MGFWRNIKGIWNPQARAKGYLEAQVQSYAVAKRLLPERDPNAWLARALMSRMGWGGRPEWVYHSETALFSLAPGMDAPGALGFFVMYKEEPALAAQYSEQFKRIVGPIFERKLASPKQFLQEWEAANPWTAAHFPELRPGLLATSDEVAEISDALDEGRTPISRARAS